MDSSKPKCGLLALLPKPKNTNAVASKAKQSALLIKKTTSINSGILPKKPRFESDDQPSTSAEPEISNKMRNVTATISSLVAYGSSDEDETDMESDNEGISQNEKNGDDDDDDSNADFFGINSKPFVAPIVSPTTSVNEPQLEETMVGPAKPSSMMCSYPTLDEIVPQVGKALNVISDQEVSKMIYEKELAPFGASTILAKEAADNIIDVSVDTALGPNIRQNLLKNLNNKVMAQVAVGPLPKVRKDPKDKLSKQKHQITHLAGLAVAREEQLQEQWADNKQKKRASARRYGF